MSYEGFDQYICKNGHYYFYGAGYFDDVPNCPYCGAESAFCNSVDQTNGPPQGELKYPKDFEHLLLSPAANETCDHCGHTKRISEAVYRAPTGEEMEPYRHYYHEEMSDGEYKEMTREELDKQEEESLAAWNQFNTGE